MNFGDLQQEVYDRGFDYLDVDEAGRNRVKRWVNQAYLELCEGERWPFLRTTATGAAPLTVSDMGQLESVADTDQNSIGLAWRDYRDLAGQYSDMTLTGSPRWFYIDNGVIRTWPVGGTLSVTYFKVPAELSADDDEPLVPSRFHDVIVDLAVVRAYKDSDNFEALANLRAEADRQVNMMRESLLDQQDVSSDLISVTAGADDW